MSSIQESIKTAIEADATIMAILTGGVYTRPIKRDRNDGEPTVIVAAEGSTPDAFETDPPYRIKPNLTIDQRMSEVEDANGPNGSMMAFPILNLRARPIQTEKDKLDAAWVRLRVIFGVNGKEKPFAMPGGAAMMTKIVGRLGPMDDPTFTNCVVLQVRMQINGIWEV